MCNNVIEQQLVKPEFPASILWQTKENRIASIFLGPREIESDYIFLAWTEQRCKSWSTCY